MIFKSTISRRNANVKVGKHFTDSPIDILVQFLFCNCTLSSNSAPLRLGFVEIIKAEEHRSENDIRTLKKDMRMGTDIGDIALPDM